MTDALAGVCTRCGGDTTGKGAAAELVPCTCPASRPHIVDGQFKSDKYPWCPAGFVPLKITDPHAQPSLWDYAQRHRVVDAEFSEDLETVLRGVGFAVGPAEEASRAVDPIDQDWIDGSAMLDRCAVVDSVARVTMLPRLVNLFATIRTTRAALATARDDLALSKHNEAAWEREATDNRAVLADHVRRRTAAEAARDATSVLARKLRDGLAMFLRYEQQERDHDPSRARKDHACGECVPGGEIVQEGFLCAYHRAPTLIAEAGVLGATDGDAPSRKELVMR